MACLQFINIFYEEIITIQKKYLTFTISEILLPFLFYSFFVHYYPVRKIIHNLYFQTKKQILKGKKQNK